MYIYIYMYTYTHIYIYIYIERERYIVGLHRVRRRGGGPGSRGRLPGA